MKHRHKRFERLEDVYRYIVNYKIQCDGVSPTIRQICKGANVSSTYVVYTHIEKLKDDGRITYILGDKGKVIGYAVTGGQWKSPSDLQRFRRFWFVGDGEKVFKLNRHTFLVEEVESSL